MSSTTVSSSGKVLLAGGYLVLDPAHSGLVVSTSSRFYTHIRPANGSPSTIVVRSPQFENATWAYAVHSAPTGVQIDQTNSEAGSNKFVHLALQRTFQLAAEIQSPEQISAALQNGLDVAIVGDNDFYSQRATLAKQGLPPLLASLNRLPPFGKTGVSLREVHKTGLGSSAALITSLITALLIHLEIVSRASFSGTAASSEAAEKTSKDRNLAHNLSQYVHCLAQGKVGSGFDVAAAVFGSQIYTRFDPAVLSPLMVDELTPGTRLLDVLSPDNTKWNHRVRPFKLPPNVRLMLADVDAGSDTPSLVGKVLKWRESHKDQADELWSTLDRSNQTLATALNRLTDLSKQDGNVYAAAITHISSLPAGQWRSTSNENTDLATVVTAFADAHDAAQTIREKMRGMGERAGVPIEPREQTALLDACIGQEGVIGGGVPGAGGYDAVWVLVAAEGEGAMGEGLRGPVGRVESVWSSWKELDVSPLSAQESSGGVGCRLEDVERVKGLKAALEV